MDIDVTKELNQLYNTTLLYSAVAESAISDEDRDGHFTHLSTTLDGDLKRIEKILNKIRDMDINGGNPNDCHYAKVSSISTNPTKENNKGCVPNLKFYVLMKGGAYMTGTYSNSRYNATNDINKAKIWKHKSGARLKCNHINDAEFGKPKPGDTFNDRWNVVEIVCDNFSRKIV